MSRREYGMDPLEILIRREERSCKGCVYIDRIRIVDVERKFCRLIDAPAERRCNKYVERILTSMETR
ncbi:hypothetical protein BURPSPAST_C1388 [Burkholderia pseudomallei Pasteur 52237]|nr:hypothetical protein BURPSPAST_C1388 [Burkholderia pseudomallei Pasteur 52237]